MGSYTSFSINGYEVFSDKNTFSNIVMALFTENMKETCYYDNDGESFTRYIYRIKSLDFAKRLDIMGYTYKAAKEDFLNNYEENEYFKFLEDEYKPVEADYDFFYKKLKYIITNNIHYWDFDVVGYLSDDDIEEVQLLKYIFETTEYHGYLMGMPLSNHLYLFRIILEMFEYEGEVIYDLSDIVDSGYYEETYEFANNAKLANIENQYRYGSIIIITEGKTDRFVLQTALNKLYPNLSDLYTFFDYDIAKAPGSTGEMVKVVKSFVATKIINKVIAIFDNDTAGHEAVQELKEVDIPRNIKILTYPTIEFCRNYPTIGPTGLQHMDINGLAASIELYLGENILTENGSLIPIQWTGYNQKMKRYQGKIDEKDIVVKRFKNIVKNAPQDINWDNIGVILNEIFNAFKS